MAKYIKQELTEKLTKGKKDCYYRILSSGNIGMKELIEEIAGPGSGLSKGSVSHVIYTLIEQVSTHLANGRSVTIDGIGTFMACIGVDKEKPMDTLDGDESKRNAASLHVNGINYRADRNLIKNVDDKCRLSRGGTKRICHSPYTREQRIGRAIDYLKDFHHPAMHIADYARLTGLSRSVAARELREVSEDKSSGITYIGSGRGKIYVVGVG